jgi:hypothetical protein
MAGILFRYERRRALNRKLNNVKYSRRLALSALLLLNKGPAPDRQRKVIGTATL